MARRKLPPDQLAEAINNLGRTRRWSKNQLEGVTVYFVLNAVSPAAKPPLNVEANSSVAMPPPEP